MKVMLCPICGARMYHQDTFTPEKEGLGWCTKCEKEVIPIVTPQEYKK